MQAHSISVNLLSDSQPLRQPVIKLPLHLPFSASLHSPGDWCWCSLAVPVKAPCSLCTSGCPMPWKVLHPCLHSFMLQRWWWQACSLLQDCFLYLACLRLHCRWSLMSEYFQRCSLPLLHAHRQISKECWLILPCRRSVL